MQGTSTERSKADIIPLIVAVHSFWPAHCCSISWVG